MATRAEQREATRRALLTEGRRRFAADGYAAVGLAEVAGAVGVTKGAAYHHFASKSGLFRAVLAETQAEVAEEVANQAEVHTDAWGRLAAGCRAFLVASADPGRRRVMLVDGPAVLGWAEWRELDEATSAHHLADAVRSAMAAGELPPQPVDPLVRLLSGAMNEAALWLAEATGPGDLTDTLNALTRLLDGVRAGPGPVEPTPAQGHAADRRALASGSDEHAG